MKTRNTLGLFALPRSGKRCREKSKEQASKKKAVKEREKQANEIDP